MVSLLLFLKFKELGLEENYLELIQNSMMLSKLGRKKIKEDKIRLNEVQKRVLNLYSSLWIDHMLEEAFLVKPFIKQNINERFRDLINNNSIIFVNEFMDEQFLKKQFEFSLQINKICYLHAVGGRNIRLCEK